MFRLPELPYAYDALAPTISDRTMREHHLKHHAAYVDKVNELAGAGSAGTDSLEQLIATAKAGGQVKLFNNAAQAWNHGFFWASMTPQQRPPTNDLAAAIDRAFGDPQALRRDFVRAGVDQFGSGWVWLVAAAGGGLEIRATHDAEGAAPVNVAPLLVCDLWEHAYYLDHQHDRKGFLEAWFDRLADWSFAADQFAAARSGAPGWRFAT